MINKEDILRMWNAATGETDENKKEEKKEKSLEDRLAEAKKKREERLVETFGHTDTYPQYSASSSQDGKNGNEGNASAQTDNINPRTDGTADNGSASTLTAVGQTDTQNGNAPDVTGQNNAQPIVDATADNGVSAQTDEAVAAAGAQPGKTPSAFSYNDDELRGTFDGLMEQSGYSITDLKEGKYVDKDNNVVNYDAELAKYKSSVDGQANAMARNLRDAMLLWDDSRKVAEIDRLYKAGKIPSYIPKTQLQSYVVNLTEDEKRVKVEKMAEMRRKAETQGKVVQRPAAQKKDNMPQSQGGQQANSGEIATNSKPQSNGSGAVTESIKDYRPQIDGKIENHDKTLKELSEQYREQYGNVNVEFVPENPYVTQGVVTQAALDKYPWLKERAQIGDAIPVNKLTGEPIRQYYRTDTKDVVDGTQIAEQANKSITTGEKPWDVNVETAALQLPTVRVMSFRMDDKAWMDDKAKELLPYLYEAYIKEYPPEKYDEKATYTYEGKKYTGKELNKLMNEKITSHLMEQAKEMAYDNFNKTLTQARQDLMFASPEEVKDYVGKLYSNNVVPLTFPRKKLTEWMTNQSADEQREALGGQIREDSVKLHMVNKMIEDIRQKQMDTHYMSMYPGSVTSQQQAQLQKLLYAKEKFENAIKSERIALDAMNTPEGMNNDIIAGMKNSRVGLKDFMFGFPDLMESTMESNTNDALNSGMATMPDYMLGLASTRDNYAQAMEDQYTGDLFKIGKGAVVSIPFTYDFLVGSAFVDGLTKGIMKKIGTGWRLLGDTKVLKDLEKLGKKTLDTKAGKTLVEDGKKLLDTKYGKALEWTGKQIKEKTGMVAEDFLNGLTMTSTVQGAKTAADIVSRRTGQMSLDGEHYSNYGMTLGDAIYTGVMNSVVENYTEVAGERFEMFPRMMKAMAGTKLGKQFSLTRLGQWLSKLDKSSFMEIARSVNKRAKIGDVFGEGLEEELGMILSPLLVRDGNSQFSDLWNPENQLQTWGTVALSCFGMGMFGYVTAGGKMAYDQTLYHRHEGYMNKWARKGAEASGNSEKWTNLLTDIDVTDNQDMALKMSQIQSSTELTEEQKRCAINYCIESMFLRGSNVGLAKAESLGVMDKRSKARAEAFERGRGSMQLDNRDIKADFDFNSSALSQLTGKSAEELQKMSYDEIDALRGENDELDAAISQYETSRAAYEGLLDKAEEAALNAEQQVESGFAPIVDKTRGTIRKATIRGMNSAEDHEVFIVKGNIAKKEDGTVDDKASDKVIYYYDPQTDKTETGYAGMFSSIAEEEEAAPLIEKKKAEAREIATNAALSDIDGQVRVGSSFLGVDENDQKHLYHVVSQNEDGTCVVTKDGKQVRDYAPTLEELQELRDLSDLARANERRENNMRLEQMAKRGKDSGVEAVQPTAQPVAEEQPTEEQPTPQYTEVPDTFDYSEVIDDEGGVTFCTVVDDNGRNLFPDAQGVYLVRGKRKGKATDYLKVAVIDADGNLHTENKRRSKVKVGGSMTLDEFKRVRQIQLEEERHTEPVDEANVQTGQGLTKKESESFVADMEENAPLAEEIELTPENWESQFGKDGMVETPVGVVRMGEHQYMKLAQRGRNGKLGMIRPTLTNPDIIIEDESKAKEGDTAERASSYIFVKSFRREDGARFYYFTSVTVSKEGKEVVVSNQEKSRNRILRLIQEGRILWRTPKDATAASAKRQGLYYEQPGTAETAAKGSGITPHDTSSDNKGRKNTSNTQENDDILTFRDGTPVPLDKDGEADFAQMSAEQTAEWYIDNLGADGKDVVNSKVEEAKKALDAAKAMKVSGSKPAELKASAEAKESAVKSAQEAYDKAKAIADSYATVEARIEGESKEGRASIVKRALDKARRLMSKADGASEVSGVWNEVVKPVLNALYGSTSVDVNDLTPQTIEEYVASGIGAHSLNYEGKDHGNGMEGGVKQELGMKRGVGRNFDTNAFNYLLAKKGEGRTIPELAHDLWQDRPDHLREYTDQDMRNALLDVLQSAESSSDILNYTLNNRIAQAEKEIEGEAAAIDNAKHAAQYAEETPASTAETENLPFEMKPEDEAVPFSKTGEKDRRDEQEYKYDHSTKEGRQRLIDETAIDETDIPDDVMSEPLRKAIAKIAKAMGVKVQYLNTDDFGANGFVQGGVMYLSVSPEKTVPFVFGHEMTHKVREMSEDAYHNLKTLARSLVEPWEWHGRMAAVSRVYRDEVGYGTDDSFEEEVVADILGDTINDTNMLDRLATGLAEGKKTKSEKFMDKILGAVKAVKEFFNGVDYYEQRIDNVAKRIEQAYREAKTKVGEKAEEEKAIRDTNRQFNKRLRELVLDPNQKDRVLHLGTASSFLIDGGIPKAPIVLEYDKLVRKSKASYKNNHPYSPMDLQDLPLAIANPIAVFGNTNGNNDGKVILTEMQLNGHNFIVAVQTVNENRKGGVVLVVNHIATIFPKEAKGIVYWFNNQKATNIEKEKALNYIKALQNHSGTSITAKELNDATNIVNNFKSPNVSTINNPKKSLRTNTQEIIHRAKESDTYLRTPNGEVSALTTEQWADVRTDNFKEFFGDWENDPENASQMVDENGEPKVFYHNTDNSFTAFDEKRNGSHTDAGWLGDGFYFYGEKNEGSGYGKNKMAVYLDMRNPYYATAEDVKRLSEANSREESVAFRQELEDEGYDGVYYNGDLRQEAVAFRPNQIKSATDNNGNYSKEEGDIRFSLRQKPDPKKIIKVYKLMRLGEDGRSVMPLYIGSSERLELGKWYDADSPALKDLKSLPSGSHIVDNTTGEAMSIEDFKAEHPEFAKMGGKPNVKAVNWATANNCRWILIKDKNRGQGRYGGEKRSYYNYGINGSGAVGEFAMRPGWHAGSLPTMRQIGKGKEKNLRDDDFVWVEGEMSADKDYNAEAQKNADKDIPDRIPEDGFYMKSTNANAKAAQADKVGWYVGGSFKPIRFMSDAEADAVVDKWNAEHPDTEPVEKDWRRESGKVFNAETMQLEDAPQAKFSLRLDEAKRQTETDPTEAQKESGNYKKGHIKFGGYDYTVENPAGSYRRGVDESGKEWSQKMHDTYGYIRGKWGKDGDHIDMFINDKADLDDWNGNVYVVDQVNKDGTFDEHKVMYGYDTEEEARKAYLSNYEKGWTGLGAITGVSKADFDKWLDSSRRKMKPFSEHSVTREADKMPETFEEFLQSPIVKFSVKTPAQRKAAEDAYNYASENRPDKFSRYAIVDMTRPGMMPEYMEKKAAADNWRRYYNKLKWGNYKLFDLDKAFEENVGNLVGKFPDKFRNEIDAEANAPAEISAYVKKLLDSAIKVSGSISALRKSIKESPEIFDYDHSLKELKRYVDTHTDEEIAAAYNKVAEKGVKLSKRKNDNSLDAEYLQAVEDGDMEKAQRMVNEAAERAGYSSSSDYQGTSAFNGAAPWGNAYFLTRQERKEAWESGDYDGDTSLGDYIKEGIDGGNLEELTNAASYCSADSMRKEAIDNVRRAVEGKAKAITMYRSVPADVKEGSFRNGDWVTPSKEYAKDNAALHGWGKDYRIIEQKVPVDDVWFDGNDIAEWGYGNEQDFAEDRDFGYKNTENNRKSLDAVTYDESGNVIPLSERFNEEKSDVKFSLPNNIKKGKLRKLRESKPAVITGEEIPYSADLKQYKKNALEYGKTLRGVYTNDDTGEKIELTAGNQRDGLREILQHDYKDVEHLQSIAAIPQIIEKSVFVEELPNEDASKYPGVKSFRYYICGLKIGKTDYTVKAVVALQSNGDRYYDHKLTQIEKGKLLSIVPTIQKAGIENSLPDSLRKDKRLLSILQTEEKKNAAKMSLRSFSEGKPGAIEEIRHSLSEMTDAKEIDDAVSKTVDGMPKGWREANPTAVNVMRAMADERKREIEGDEPEVKFSLPDRKTLIKGGTYFSGGGLVEEGLRGVMDPSFAVEYDEKISGVYRDNFGNHIVTADVRDVDPKKLIGKIDGEVGYFHASPVCKNYSQAKLNKEELELDKETAASTAEFIQKVRPKVVTIENVKGYRSSDAMKEITDALDEAGYDWDAHVYNAADYGGYTNRERLIVRAVRDGKLPPVPKKQPRKGGWYEAVEDILETMPEKKNGIAPWMDERLKADGIDWRMIDKPLYVMGSGYANGTVPHAFADELLPTLRTKSGDVIVMPGGKVYRAMGRVIARISGMGDDYRMPSSEALSHTIVGNGIPVQLTRGVIAPLLEQSGGVRLSRNGNEEKVKFSLIGIRGAAALDQAYENNELRNNRFLAENMETEGKDAKAIKMATGWERSADGTWRYEIPDPLIDGVDRIVSEKIEKQVAAHKPLSSLRLAPIKLADAIGKDHPLIKAYPELKQLKIKFKDLGQAVIGQFDRRDYSITLNSLAAKLPGGMQNYFKTTLAHEIQHAIQHLEGFEPGGSGTNPNYMRLSGEVEARNVERRMKMTPEERRQSLAAETEDVAREDQIFLYGDGGAAMSFGEPYDYERYPRGKVEPGLAEKEVKIVEADAEHGFKNYREAKEWAKQNVAKTYSVEETGGKGEVRVSNGAIDKFLSQSAVGKSDTKDVHLSVLKVLPEVLKTSVDAETHPDFLKGENGKRAPKNSINKDVLVHRCYGAVDIDGNLYRVKMTLKENIKTRETINTHSYEATKIELLAGQHGDVTMTSPRNSNNSISGAKLLKDVEMSYDSGKKLLDESEKNSLDTFPRLRNAAAQGGDVRFSKRGDTHRSLVGVHNISEEKLLKALKLGGLANPSVAVIDSDRQEHNGYGEISLIMPSEKIAKRTGKNAGTFFGDAWTPTYPQVERQFGKGGSEKAERDIDSVPKEMQRMTRNAVNSWLDGRDADGLAYLYLQEKGKAPDLVRMKGKYGASLHKAMQDITHGEGLYKLDEDGRKKALDLLIGEIYGGDRKAYDEDIAIITKNQQEFLSKMTNPKSLLARNVREELDWIEEHGYDYDALSRFVDEVNRDAKSAGEVSDSQTMLKAQQAIEKDGLKQDFERWKDGLAERYGVKEVIFDDFTPSGNRRYVPNDLEHVSRIMKKRGLAGASGSGFSFNQFAATIMEKTGSLSELRKRKDMLTENHADMDVFTEEWGKVYNELADAMNPNPSGFLDDAGYYRLAEAALQSDPKAFAKKEYDVDLTDRQVEGIRALVNAIRKERPTMYFETKFERPVGLDEFTAAVVPGSLSETARQGLERAGLRLYEYDPKTEGDRKRAFQEATSENEERVKFALKQANDRFNSELDAFSGKTHHGLMHLGAPSAVLKACGVVVDEITLSPKTLNRKLKQHSLSVEDVKDLVNAIQRPILVYRHGEKAPNVVVVTDAEVNGDKLSIALELDKAGNVVDLNNVSSIHGKDADAEVKRLLRLSPVELKKALRWVEKDKVLGWLGSARLFSHIQTEDSQGLSLAKVINDFENPIVEDENFANAEGNGMSPRRRNAAAREEAADRDTGGEAARFSLRNQNDNYEQRLAEWKEKNGLAEDAEPLERPVYDGVESANDFMDRMAEWTRNKNLWKTAPKPMGYWDALELWKQEHGIPADEFPPTKPRRQDYETEEQFDKAMDEYNKNLEKWQRPVAPNEVDYKTAEEYREAMDKYHEEARSWTEPPRAIDYDLAYDINDVNKRFEALRKAVTNQRMYDQRTVSAVTDLIREMIALGWGDNMGRGTVKRLLSAVKNVTGQDNVKKWIDKAMTILTDNYLNTLKKEYQKILDIKASRLDQSGIVRVGQLDVIGQGYLREYKRALESTEDDNGKRIAALEQDSFKNQSHKEANEAMIDAIQTASRYRETIGSTQNDISDLQDMINELSDYNANNKYSTNPDVKAKIKQNREIIKSATESIEEHKAQLIRMYNDHLEMMNGALVESKDRAREFREAVKERRLNVLKLADADMEGRDASNFTEDTLARKFFNSWPMKIVTSSTYSFEQYLKLFGYIHNATGEGYLYNHFMPSWLNAVNEQQIYMEEHRKMLDEKASEIFGKKIKYSDLIGITGKDFPGIDIEVVDEGNPAQKRNVHLTQGQMLYIYLVSKQTDGRMKLAAQGIYEDEVAAMSEKIDPRLKELGEWIQDEYLPQNRQRYQETHVKFFGAPMREVEHYFPIKVNQRARYQNEDVAKDTQAASQLVSTATGAIVTRRVNTLPLDIENTDAFSAVLDNLTSMEEWSAMLPFRQDINTLLSSTKFRNQVHNMSSKAYGNQDRLWNQFKQCAQIAAGTYRARTDAQSLDKAFLKTFGLVSMAKISWRLWTAFKQTLSAPAFLTEADTWRFVKNGINPYGSYKWAYENLPIFRSRVESMAVGDTRIKALLDDVDKAKDILVGIGNKGMIPNVFVDAVTCAVGARSVYETDLAKMKSLGYSEEQAQEKALNKAAISYNRSQQSSEGAFVSPMQVDRTYLTAVLSLFKNSPYSYGRNIIDAVRGLSRTMPLWNNNRNLAIDSMKRRIMEQDGIDDEAAARKIAESAYKRTRWKSIATIVNYFTVMPILWNLGSNVLYCLLGDDDDKKKDMLLDASIKGSATTISDNYVIPFVSDMINSSISVENGEVSFDIKNIGNTRLYKNPATSDIASMIGNFSHGNFLAILNKFGNIGVQAMTGFNPQTLGDMLEAASEWDGNGDTPTEVKLALMKLLNSPEDNIRNLMMDELGLNRKEASKVTVAELERRYAERRINRENGLTKYLMKSGEYDELVEKYAQQFEERIKENMDRIDDLDRKKADQIYDNTLDPKIREMISKKRDADSQKRIDEEFGKNEQKKKEPEFERVYKSVSRSSDLEADGQMKYKEQRLKRKWKALEDEYNSIEDKGDQSDWLYNHPKYEDYLYDMKDAGYVKKEMQNLKKELPSSKDRDSLMREIRKLRQEYIQMLDEIERKK